MPARSLTTLLPLPRPALCVAALTASLLFSGCGPGGGDAPSDTDSADTDACVPAGEDTSADGTDQDCDGLDGPDADGDGYVDMAAGGDDCDDADAASHPGASEVWGDGLDQDCDGAADVEGARCSADFTLTMPDGSTATLDFCRAWDLAAALEYDPDDAPEVLSFTATLNASAESDFQCSITLSQSGVCGTGYYDAADTAQATTLVTLDCADVSDTYETTQPLDEGYLRLDTLDAGTAAGSFAGEPLATTIAGRLHARGGGFDLDGTFDLARTQIAPDGEEQAECSAVDASELDADADGWLDIDDCEPAIDYLHPYDSDSDGVEDECGWQKVRAGGSTTCGMDSDGGFRCWDVVAPELVYRPEYTLVDVQPALQNVYGLTDLNRLVCWGDYCEALPSSSVRQFDVSSGNRWCAIQDSGEAKCSSDIGDPVETNLAYVTAGAAHGCGIDVDGHGVCWGSSADGPELEAPPTIRLAEIAAGSNYYMRFTAAVDEDGVLHQWGSLTASPPAGRFHGLASGASNSCALDNANFVQCWGLNGATAPLTGPYRSIDLSLSSTGVNVDYDLGATVYYHSERLCAIDTAGAIECLDGLFNTRCARYWESGEVECSPL